MSKRLISLCALVLLLAQCGTPAMPGAPASSKEPLGKVALAYRLRDFLTSGRGMPAVFWCGDEISNNLYGEAFDEYVQTAIPELARTCLLYTSDAADE